ncbi:hypothetical protein LTR16_004214 [Cryomyces antarcticus]|uniref:Uncharacterized protein n=1 Tax=Cryomyces antarcticus TaxID=329879 RepID=A0ABR0LQ85_9PEZI|nr:hypothetical protein LTR60_006600 [Cryomyces antarcticus]KAK5016537.1 hypothetical protein LTR39_002034 [Cryomyces antarcticus]KAK5200988.1 hypothetical protein LTR16_004214 [Cryomyces antarcticus]
MRQWDEDDSYTEVTDEELHKARQNEVYDANTEPCQTQGPQARHDVTDSFTEEEDLLATPSKNQAKRLNAGSKRTFAEILACDTGKKQAAKPRAKAAVKPKAGATKRTAAPKTSLAKINLTFKATKPASAVAKGAAEKNPSKSPNRKPKPALQEGAKKVTSPAKRKQPMGPVSPQAARNNTPTPHKPLPVSFPGLKKQDFNTDFRAVRPENSPPADMLKLMN